MAFPGSTFPNPCNRAPLRHFLPTPKRMHAFDKLPYAEQGALSERPHTPSKAHLSAGFRMANRTHFLNKPHMPNRTHASGKLPYAEREGVNRLNIVWLPERAFHAGSMPCSHNGLLFVSHISCWRRKRRPFKSRSSTLQKKPASKGSWFPPFENGSAAEAEFAPRRRLLFVPRRRLLKKEKTDFLRSRLFGFRMVPEARVELARLSTTVFETAASAIPPLGREIELYPMFPKAQTEISEHAQKATIQAENR